MVAISTQSLEYPRHLVAVVGPKGRGPQVAPGPQFEQHRRDALVVGGLDYGDEVVRPYRPVGLFDRRPVLLGEFVGLPTSLDGIPDVPYPLVGPVHQGHVGRHTRSAPPSSRPSSPRVALRTTLYRKAR